MTINMRRAFLWLTLAFSLLAVLFLRFYPLTIIQPFKHQSPEPLQRALFVLRIAPVTSILLALLSVAVTVWMWSRMRLLSRIGSSVLVLLTCVGAVLVRVNVFELMFHPAGAPRFLAAKHAKIDADDMLITVALNRDSHAYPIREMGYHHVVNDLVGGVPIVATY
jgi:hypothetical protein